MERVESDSDFWSLPVMEREQGIIVAPGVKRKVKSLTDVTREGVRFVNRQRGSGTRILLDSWLSEAGIAPGRIDGYDQKSLRIKPWRQPSRQGRRRRSGTKAAAAQFNLGFIPLTTETYRLAGAIDTRGHEAVAALIAATHQQAAKLPGYRVLTTERR